VETVAFGPQDLQVYFSTVLPNLRRQADSNREKYGWVRECFLLKQVFFAQTISGTIHTSGTSGGKAAFARAGVTVSSHRLRFHAFRARQVGGRCGPVFSEATVAALEEMGIVERKPHPTDGRQVNIELTAKGAAMRKSAKDAKRTWLAEAIAQLDEQERETLFRAGEIIKRLAEK